VQKLQKFIISLKKYSYKDRLIQIYQHWSTDDCDGTW